MSLNKAKTVSDKMKGYARKSAFASFLPGIAGVKGTPIWCYYVNRGQGVVSFGVQDKDHSIMEFYPAHTAYLTVSRTGFRTFIKADGRYYEPFKAATDDQQMDVHMNALLLEDYSKELGIRTNVRYTTLPGEEIGALVRIVTVTNESGKTQKLEVADGMPALIPFGCDMNSLKTMAQTTKAWMQVEDLEDKRPFYRVRVSMEDSAVVKKVKGGNFAVGMDEEGNRLSVIVDPGVLFAYDLSLTDAVGFEELGAKGVLSKKQNVSNELPCSFFIREKELAKGESITFYELIGQVRNKEVLDEFLSKELGKEYFEAKFAEAEDLAASLTDAVATQTANETFDDYCRYNYMDNVLRGGTPIKLPGGHTFYVYSRKHGDLERDYNYFSMSPEFYSQGNGNFRDVNQNRRCDTFFSDIVMDKNINMFYSLIQLDGYNPLKIEQVRFTAPVDVLGELELKMPFTPGALYSAIIDQKKSLSDEEKEKLFADVMSAATETVNGDFGEGYWSDHWDYNLDLIEDFLEVYPDREKALLYETVVKSFDAKEKVLPRHRRYEKTENGIRQYHYLESRDNTCKEGSFALDKKGNDVTMSLIAKLFLMSAVKFATLDAEGMGVEMEGGKPGWYDALNGMPGMLGSSMNESYELLRMIRFTKNAVERFGEGFEIPAEVYELALGLKNIEDSFTSDMDAWNKRNDLKEGYREKVYEGFGGSRQMVSADEAAGILASFEGRIAKGASKALDIGEGISPAYFTFDVTDYSEKEGLIIPEKIEHRNVPYFLEGPVRALKLDSTLDEKRALYNKVKNSDLYDSELSMYKVNASLADASFEYGRCRAFTPGWLENESIWLHMEYKYLLELIRSGLYKEFFEDLKKAAVPFLDKEVYGRSTLENSSFIASSKNPNEAIRGKGFVARLSGSTIEFISMWKLMFFGKSLFKCKDGELVFAPAPAIPEYLVKEDGGKNTVSAMMRGRTLVTYEMDKKTDYFPGGYEIAAISAEFEDGSRESFEGPVIRGEKALLIREGKATKLEIKMILK
ncbi:MAG: hypothetical protein K6G10_09980 [Butyrivibrio sp.]|nr:hypothetical protein [Butyrivibrio sp.]